MTLVQAIGWAGTAAFFSRFLIQWLQSERLKRSVAPRSFWWLSIFGSVCLAIYAIDRGEPVLLVGILINGAIFARNLWISLTPRKRRRVSPLVLLSLTAGAAILLVLTDLVHARSGWSASPGWLACVLVGQAVWSSRFVIQWFFAEKRRKSHFPPSFWWTSLAGNALLLAYALHLADPIFVAGFLLGPVVQTRNLILCYRGRRSRGFGGGAAPAAAPRAQITPYRQDLRAPARAEHVPDADPAPAPLPAGSGTSRGTRPA